jgi:hypothetical protein
MAAVYGNCCICGLHSKLSFEHVPPRAAYNDQRVFEANIQKLVAAKWDGQMQTMQGKWVQRGAGKETLCEPCNNDTGSWYGTPYVSWAKQAVELLGRSGGTLSLAYPYTIYSLRVLKQVLTMFCSACGPSLSVRFPELPKFILQKTDQYMPHGLRVYAYLLDAFNSVGHRQAGMTGVLKGRQQHVFAEVAFAPFGFVLTGDPMPIHPDLLDITFLSHSRYHEREHLFLKLPVLPINTWLPGDYRTKEQVKRDVVANERLGRVDLDVMR